MDTYFPVLENMDEKIDKIDDELANAPTSLIMHQIFALKNTLSMRKILGPQQEC